MKGRIIIHCENSFQALTIMNCHDSHIYVKNNKTAFWQKSNTQQARKTCNCRLFVNNQTDAFITLQI